MDVYDLLELLTRGARLAEPVERDALDLVGQLRKICAFGTMTAATAVDHSPAGINYFNRVCTICHREHDF